MDEDAILNSGKIADSARRVGTQASVQQRCPWPETPEDAGVFEISDDEDDDQ
jgi:hypothetical protein